MAKRVIWSIRASEDRRTILTYWNHRNQSKQYSKKLNKLFNECISLIQDFPNIGVQTDLDNVRKLNAGHYAIFYSVEPDFIAILAIWDGRQDPDKLKI